MLRMQTAIYVKAVAVLYLDHNRQIGLHEVLYKLLIAEIVCVYNSKLGGSVLNTSCICMEVVL